MDKWKKIKVSDIGKVITGKTPKTSESDNYGGEIPFLTPSDDMTIKYVRNTNKTLTDKGKVSVKNMLLPANAICVSCIGSDLGKVAITTKETITNQQINSIIVDTEKYDVDYIYYSMLILGKVLNYHSKTSTAVPIVNKTSFSNYEIVVPIKDVHTKIASILSLIDDKIEQNTNINNNLEQQAQAIFDNMFPDITNGYCTIGDYITPKRGKSLLSKNAIFGDIPVIAGGLEPSTYHNVANTQSPILTISASGANAGYVSLWNVPVWSSDSSFIDSTMTDDVYFWYVLLKKRQKEIFDAQTGSAQPHIYPKHIASMSISSLDIEEVHSYTSIVTPIFEMIGQHKEENTILASTRDSLLPKLISGELDVSNINL